jgi:phenylpropionate dioxygenase-like ring-hydroxylating dioxygenase large terminal subunit
MIRNQRYIVLESNEVKTKPVSVMRMWEKMVFWRGSEWNLSCFIDSCCHRKVALSLGKVTENNCLQCPFHGLEFDGKGQCTLIPANGKQSKIPKSFRVTNYQTYEKEWFIWIFWGDKTPDTTPHFFDDLEWLNYRTMKDNRDTHYSRAIENQLDCAHIPFIHKKTIGRGNRTLVNWPLIERKTADKMYMYVFNETDNWQQAKLPKELQPMGEDEFRLEFIFPNLWQNHITPKMRIVVAFVPIDNEKTLMYLRFYKWFFKVPLLEEMVFRIFKYFNRKVLHEDRRVVNTHDPKISELAWHELLFQADMPIIEYRKRRQELQKQI